MIAGLLDIAVTERIWHRLVLDCRLQPVGNKKVAERFGSLVHHGARFGQRAVVEGKLRADGVVELAVREPRKIIEIRWNARGFLHVKGDDKTVCPRLEIVLYFGEEPALHQFVGRGLEIVFSHLRAHLEAAGRGYLRL